ncbi:HpcH/HpaI aldolase/citrate lyase family protein [Xanthobacter autotrophicus]|uniref:HpcH/HpaI aldolase/citrate lyase family protein n=1 Tax=Xanthobacter autotrophicus TaxID=280 RepID=UPI00372B8D5A
MVRHTWPPPLAPLFVPGDRPDRFAKAMAGGTDAVILDLEDAVAGEAKAEARRNVADCTLDRAAVIVRVNAVGSPWFAEDLDALAARPPAAVMLPKTESASDVARVVERLGTQTAVVALVETARGLTRLAALLEAEGVACLAFGSVDFALDIGCADTWDVLAPARMELVVRSRAAGLPPPIDGVTLALDDTEVVSRDALRAAQAGFGGKLAIHPRQIDAIRQGFQPSPEELEWARKVVALGHRGAGQIDGQMIDHPVMERAARILRHLRPAD